MASWALWQALPPRYQRTCKDINVDNESANQASYPHSPRVPKSPRAITPRQGSASSRVKSASKTVTQRRPNSRGKSSEKPLHNEGIIDLDKQSEIITPGERRTGASCPRSKTIEAANTRGKCTTTGTPRTKSAEAKYPHGVNGEETDSPRGKAQMYFSTASSPRGRPADCDYRAFAKSAFPSRRSSFIDNFKQQQLINAMRHNFEDPSTASPRSQKQSSKKPCFPVTQISSESFNSQNDRKSSEKLRVRAKTATTRREYSNSHPSKRHQENYTGTESQPNLSVNTIVPLDSSVKPFLRNPLFQDKPSKRYVVRKLDDATMFIDDDKIIFIKKKTTKNDILQCQKAVDETNYLAHLRKLYLRDPKDLAKFMQNPEANKKTLIRERLEYDKRTDNILNYYSRIDDRENAFAWAMSIEAANQSRDIQGQLSSRSPRAHSSPGRRQEVSSKPQTPPTDRPATSRSYRGTNGSDLYTSNDALSDWNVFVKFNSQSILHDRQFYLQTPMVSPESTSSAQNKKATKDSCECRLCLLEMEMMKQYEPTQIVNVNQSVETADREMKKEDSGSDNKTKIFDSSSTDRTLNNGDLQIKKGIDKNIQTETFDSPSGPTNSKGSEPSESDGVQKEKTTINLTIDLSIQTNDFSDVKSEEVAANRGLVNALDTVQTSSTSTVLKISQPRDDVEMTQGGVSDQRGEERTKTQTVDDERGN